MCSFFFFGSTQKAFLSKVHLKVFFISSMVKKTTGIWMCWWIFSPFSMLLKRKSLFSCAIVVCGSRRMFTIIWNTLRWRENTSLCQPHIFLPFSIITFSSMYFGDNFLCGEQYLPSSMGEKLEENCIQQFKNWKIVLKECQKHFREMLGRVLKRRREEYFEGAWTKKKYSTRGEFL